ncbi:hypothetical protein RB195_000364 [Necator americanus]|uniref:Ion transport domain-containing protein n=1 Tax=Necator americanus TaxID=51031 RepID=A0ABR1D9A0_NECAM
MTDTVILCKTVANIFSVVLHITLLLTIVFTPSLKCGGFDEPLATLTNAAEWYTNYVIILSALTFGLDRAADSTYDAIDMLFETLFFVPVLCMLNGFTIVMLYNQWNTVKKRQELKLRRGSGHLPTITELFSIYIDPEVDSTAPKSLSRLKDLQEKRMLHRLEMELSFAMIAIIDQQIDFFAVLFYTLYWASYSHYIDVNGTRFLEVYSYFFEIGNIITPYVLLCFCPDLRKEFFRRIKPRCENIEHDF